MKRFSTLLIAITLAIVLGSANVSYAQEDTMKKIGNSVVDNTKKVGRKSRRIGTTVGNKTWNGTRWVAAKSRRGGKWVAVKTKNGVKWVWRRGKRTKRAL
jgi:hypothetical protein